MTDIPNPGSTKIRMPWFVYWLKYKPRVKQLAKVHINEGDVVFLGDSLTEWNDWQTAFPEIKVHNFGIAGDTSYGVLSRIHQITSGNQPSKLFLLIGTNDMFTFGRVGMKELLLNIETILKSIRTSFPETKIYVQGIMPRQVKYGEAIKQLNMKIEKLISRCGENYLDLWPIMDDGTGKLRREYTRDNLHLNDTAKRKWIEYLRPLVIDSQTQ
ncbi:MAG: GDSL-type esterase/lipase family protein [Gammaproteobacteria bacterium]|nr:GDSL-type esterase/lipase family protein [Gammaproteobacteria bacterium]